MPRRLTARRGRRHAARAGCLLMLAVSSAGCAAAAATQLIPLAFQGATFAGVSVGSAVTGKDPTEDTQDMAERCDQLVAKPPLMGELVQAESGQKAVRGVMLGEQAGGARWFLTTNVVSFASFQFAPPLSGDQLDPKKPHFLAYAPAQPQDVRESDQLVSLLGSFEPGPGVLNLGGKTYKYSWVQKLPCFQPAH